MYVDETGLNLYTRRAYGTAQQGECVNRIVRGQQGLNVTVLAAMSDKVGLLYHEVYWETVKRDTFVYFMTSSEIILGNEDAFIILDNASCHSRVNEFFENMRIHFLPAYIRHF